MNNIPILSVAGNNIPEAFENALITLYKQGCKINTQYDKESDVHSLDATMLITVIDPLSEPMIHRDFPGGLADLQEYVMEVVDGIKDHWISPETWKYTYHKRLFNYEISSLNYDKQFDQIEQIIKQLSKTPYTRRAQAVTWKVWEDNHSDDPPCLQSIWCRIHNNTLNMNVRFRSNDAYKASFMNIYSLVRLQESIARRISELTGNEIGVGRYCHLADSFHIYGCNLHEFENRFLKSLDTRSFEKRTFRYCDVKEIMEEARPIIMEKCHDTKKN